MFRVRWHATRIQLSTAQQNDNWVWPQNVQCNSTWRLTSVPIPRAPGANLRRLLADVGAATCSRLLVGFCGTNCWSLAVGGLCQATVLSHSRACGQGENRSPATAPRRQWLGQLQAG